jgi:hypothetical protein
MALNKKLIQKLINHLNENPLLYEQKEYFTAIDLATGNYRDSKLKFLKHQIHGLVDAMDRCKITPQQMADKILEITPKETVCGSACCIAGTIFSMKADSKGAKREGSGGVRLDNNIVSISNFAAKELGLVGLGAADILFTCNPESNWPQPYRSRWKKIPCIMDSSTLNDILKIRKKQVKVATDLLKDLMENGEQVLVG